MPFDWMHPRIPEEFAKKIAPRFEEMHLREIEQRARLLFNLRYDRKRVVRRIQDNIEWDFELSKVPAFFEEVPRIVDRVYGRKPG